MEIVFILLSKKEVSIDHVGHRGVRYEFEFGVKNIDRRLSPEEQYNFIFHTKDKNEYDSMKIGNEYTWGVLELGFSNHENLLYKIRNGKLPSIVGVGFTQRQCDEIKYVLDKRKSDIDHYFNTEVLSHTES